MSLIGRLDLLASAGSTPWHRASALGKLLLALGVVLAAVASRSLPLLVALHLVAWSLVLSCRMPWRIVVAAASYPLLVAGLFVIASWGGGARAQAILLLRPVTASLMVLWLVATTPYPDLFAPVSRVLPRHLADGLFLTYRALFELLGRTERLWRALSMRGGAAAPPGRRLMFAGEGLATLVLYGFERSQRLYAALLLRGHSGRICGCRHWAEFGPADLWVAAVAAVVVTAVIFLGGRA
jgi:cobalt/nickel transport system permease protein